MKKITKLNEEQIKRLATKRDEWLKIGLSTERADREQAQQGALEAYQAAGLQPPKVFIWLDSPKQGPVGAALLSGTNFSGNQVMDQVMDQVGYQVWDQVWDQVGGQVMGQVRAQVWDQVVDQVWEQTKRVSKWT